MEENISESFYKSLEGSQKPVQTLVAFSCSVFDIKFEIIKLYAVMGKLIKLYGRYNVFFSILDAANFDMDDAGKFYNVIAYYCKKHLEGLSEGFRNDLTNFANENKRFLGGNVGQ